MSKNQLEDLNQNGTGKGKLSINNTLGRDIDDSLIYIRGAKVLRDKYSPIKDYLIRSNNKV